MSSSRVSAGAWRYVKRLLGWGVTAALVMTIAAGILEVVPGDQLGGAGVRLGPATFLGGDEEQQPADGSGTTDGAAPLSRAFAPIADAYVNGDKPEFNYGDASTLRVDEDPAVVSYLRFKVEGLDGPLEQATLRIYATSASTQGFLVQGLAAGGWSESAITHRVAPPPDSALLASVDPFAQQTWIDIDVTAVVRGEGTYDFVLTGFSRTAISFGSRESDRPPTLLVELGSPS